MVVVVKGSIQICSISSKLLLHDLKCDIVYNNGVSLQVIVVYMKFTKKVTVVGKNGPFYPNFAPPAASQTCISFQILLVG